MLNNQDVEWQQKRETVRIDVSLPVWCRRIREEDLPEKKEELALRLSNLERIGWNTAQIAEKKRDNTDEWSCNLLSLHLLWDINQKLGRLINLLEHKEDRESEEWEAKALDLSGYGIRIISPREIKADGYLQLEIKISLFPMMPIISIGKVIWVKNLEEKDPPKWEARVKFEAINEDDREEIIRFIFHQQRMFLRARVPQRSED